MMMNTRRVLAIVILLPLVLLAIVSISEAREKHQSITARDSLGSEEPPFSRSHERVENAGDTSIHRHWEGVILPVDGQPGYVRLQNVTLEAYSRFFSCMVRNFIIDSTVTITLENSSEESVTNYTLGFPFSTHALYGDHNQFRDISISVDGIPIQFEVAMDHTLYEIQAGSLYHEGRLINGEVHPLITDTTDIRDLSPFLVEESFDMVAYWQTDFAPHQQRVVQIEYTSNSNDFSYCCPEVSDPTHGITPYHFHFDLSNAGYWQYPTMVNILLHDTDSAIWSDVPQLDLQRSLTETTIAFWGEDVWLTEDLTIPAQPSVFGITPRCWPSDEASDEVSQQEFTLKWIGDGCFFTSTEIHDITATVGVAIEDVVLPLYLSETSPTASFSATLNLAQLSEPAYIDVYGTGLGWAESLYQSFVRVPILIPTSTPTTIHLPFMLKNH
jgi:hypothetical protein